MKGREKDEKKNCNLKKSWQKVRKSKLGPSNGRLIKLGQLKRPVTFPSINFQDCEKEFSSKDRLIRFRITR